MRETYTLYLNYKISQKIHTLACLYVDALYACYAYRGQKRTLDLLGLQIKRIEGIRCVLGSKPRLSTKSTSALSH